ncbi:hypothetical protein Fmac_008385 [Flemingia macrophylla]|uniref:DUF676 domain-containing protein n=1 Tax=Flemingia macrophylla TaxID=520843 RepID=A0ABD1MZM2_9FABA
MLPSDSGSVLRPNPPIPTTPSLFSPPRFHLGSRPARPKLSLRMDLLRRMGHGCFKAQAHAAGQDVFDAAAAAAPQTAPHHLVIMVNGIIGSAADWRYAAEQFVKRLPDKVIVHRKHFQLCQNRAAPFPLHLKIVDNLAEFDMRLSLDS